MSEIRTKHFSCCHLSISLALRFICWPIKTWFWPTAVRFSSNQQRERWNLALLSTVIFLRKSRYTWNKQVMPSDLKGSLSKQDGDHPGRDRLVNKISLILWWLFFYCFVPLVRNLVNCLTISLTANSRRQIKRSALTAAKLSISRRCFVEDAKHTY